MVCMLPSARERTARLPRQLFPLHQHSVRARLDGPGAPRAPSPVDGSCAGGRVVCAADGRTEMIAWLHGVNRVGWNLRPRLAIDDLKQLVLIGAEARPAEDLSAREVFAVRTYASFAVVHVIDGCGSVGATTVGASKSNAGISRDAGHKCLAPFGRNEWPRSRC